jgi:hypothetical protein
MPNDSQEMSSDAASPSIPPASWDPFGILPDDSALAVRQEALQRRIKEYAAGRKALVRKLVLSFVAYIIALMLAGIFIIIARNAIPFGVALLGCVFAYAITFGQISTDQNSLIRLLAAQRQGWRFYPGEESDRLTTLASRFPKMFATAGLTTSSIFDQIWGTYSGTPFWRASFFCETGVEKYSNAHSYTLYTFPLRHTGRQNIVAWFGSGLISLGKRLPSKELPLRANGFNAELNIAQFGETVVSEAIDDITQTCLLELYRQSDPFTTLFSDNTLVLALDRGDSGSHHTNILRAASVDPRDLEVFEARMKTVLATGTKIAQNQ